VESIENPTVQERLAKLGVEPMIMTPADFDARVAKEVAIAKDLAKTAHTAVQ